MTPMLHDDEAGVVWWSQWGAEREKDGGREAQGCGLKVLFPVQ